MSDDIIEFEEGDNVEFEEEDNDHNDHNSDDPELLLIFKNISIK